MTEATHQTARNRLMELAEDPLYRPFILNYLIMALDERYWPLLVEVTLEHVDDVKALQERDKNRLGDLFVERWS